MYDKSRSPALSVRCLIVAIVAVLSVVWVAPAPTLAQSDYPQFKPDPLGLIAGYHITSYYTTKTDTVEVWICTIGTEHALANLSVGQLTENLRRSGLAEHLESMSGGRYEVDFVSGGTVASTYGVHGCQGDKSHGGTSAILAIPDYEGGFGWSPRSPSFSTEYPWNRRSAAPGFYEGLQRINIAGAAAVFGWTLAWPQSYTGVLPPETGTTRIDNPMDMMSGGNRGTLHVGTIAANRYAAGWIDPSDVHIYGGGSDSVTLSVDWETGTQMIVLPTGTQGNFLSLGARVAKRHDRGIPKEGVEAYIIEQIRDSCRVEIFGPCWGKTRRTIPYPHDTEIGFDSLGWETPKNPVKHVLGVDQHLTWNDVTVTVTERIGDQWVVDIREGTEPAPLDSLSYDGQDRFTDDNSNTHEANINQIASQGITRGCSTEPAWYCPNDSVTRAEMAAFMLRAVGEPDPSPSRSHLFEDVPDDIWYTDYVHALAERGVDTGVNGQWRPTDPLTRMEMAHWITRMFEDIFPSPDPRGLFEDVPFDSEADLAAVEGLFRSGVTYGCSSDPLRYCPDSPVTRGQMASFIVRALNRR